MKIMSVITPVKNNLAMTGTKDLRAEANPGDVLKGQQFFPPLEPGERLWTNCKPSEKLVRQARLRGRGATIMDTWGDYMITGAVRNVSAVTRALLEAR